MVLVFFQVGHGISIPLKQKAGSVNSRLFYLLQAYEAVANGVIEIVAVEATEAVPAATV